jgi:hypothetical protein
MLEKIPYLNRSDSEPVDLIFNYITTIHMSENPWIIYSIERTFLNIYM